MIERAVERFIVASRWVLAPFFLALVLALVGLLVKTVQHLGEMALHFAEKTEAGVILDTLSVVDATLTGSLIVIVIFSGYENFVSRIDAAGHGHWPDWMAAIDFTGLKLKLLTSIVAISGVQLLEDFMNMDAVSDRTLGWAVGIHLAFVASSVLLAVMDKLAGGSHEG